MRRVSLVLLALIAMTLFGCDALRDAEDYYERAGVAGLVEGMA